MSSTLVEAFAESFSIYGKDQPLELLEEFTNHISSSSSEANTWRLISTLLESKQSSPLTQLARIKDWISKTSVDDEDTLQRDQDHYKLDEKITVMAPPLAKMQRLSSEVHLSESTCRQQYLKIRTNDLRPVESISDDLSIANYIVNEYINTNKAILDNQNVLPCTEIGRKLWRESVCQTLKNETLGRYGTLLYLALSGNRKEFLNQCKTWEDVIWVYYNYLVEDCITLSTSSSALSQDVHIPDQISSLALSKDQQKNSKNFFHQIQTAILSNKMPEMIDYLYKGLINKREGEGLYTSDKGLYEQRLRFISTFILFGIKYLDWEENTSTIGILSAFISLNSQKELCRPLVVTIYCSVLSQKNQIELYSAFLEKFDADMEELKVLVRMAEKYNLDIDSILLKTHNSVYQKAIIKCPNPMSNQEQIDKFTLDFDTKANENEEQLLNSLKWLTVKPMMGFKKGTELIRYFLSFGKIGVMNQVLQLLNVSDNDYQSDPYFLEIISHVRFVDVLKMLEQWKTMMENKSVNGDTSLTSNIALHNWGNEIIALEETLAMRIKIILDGAWLDEGSVDSECISNAYLRQLYVPDLIIYLHKIFYNHNEILSKPNEDCSQLVTYINVEREILLRDVVAANRLSDILDEFSRSL